MSLARFLQVSDLHLGRPFAWLPQDRRADRRRDQQRALETAVSQAIERGVHALLVPGRPVRLDRRGRGPAHVRDSRVRGERLPAGVHRAGQPRPGLDHQRRIPPAPAAARGMRWPEHVHVFDTPGWSGAPVAQAAGGARLGALLHGERREHWNGRSPLRRSRRSAGTDPAGFEVALLPRLARGPVPARPADHRAVLGRRSRRIAVRLPRGRPLPHAVAHRAAAAPRA